MPQPFHALTVDEFAALLRAFRFTRRIESVHLHHTWRPNHAQYSGQASIVAMWHYHTGVNRWSDIAQHLSIAPDGVIWTGRNWNAAPASSRGYNGTSEAGPFMIEMIGDFDVGQDPFVDPQRATTLQVIANVQRRFGLPPDALRFHNSMTTEKSCPGSQLDRSTMVADIAVLHQSIAANHGSRSMREVLPFDDDQTQIHRLAAKLAHTAASPMDERDAEPAEGEVPVLDSTTAAGERGRPDGRRPSMSELAAVRPHVVNLRDGHLSTDGAFRTLPQDVDVLFTHHLPDYLRRTRAAGQQPRIVLFAHGGLTSERDGVAIACKQVEWWMRAGVFPLFFVWETGLGETISDLVAGRLSRRAPATTASRAARGLLPERLWNRLVEQGARRARASRIWSAMKESAANASAADGGALMVVDRLRLLTAANPDIELHAIGHSAGSIFHAHLLPAAVQRGLSIRTLHLLAPAIRVDDFMSRLAPLLATGGGVEECTIFTMRDECEEADVVQLPLLQDYGRSLLYLIYNGLEDRPHTPILGLERSLRGDPELVRLFALDGGDGSHGVVWSESSSVSGRSASRSTAHGAFDDDRSTMESVMRRMLRLADEDDVVPFPELAARGISIVAAGDEEDEVALLLDALSLDDTGASNAAAIPFTAPTVATGSVPPVEQGASHSSGRRMALCVGIDAYPGRDRLNGCVRDARQWQDVLQQIGFDVTTLMDEEATRQAIESRLGALIDAAVPGDTVVFQYAGHGTEAPDVNGDETGGNNGRKDEALCPVDYAAGHLLIDDDIGAILDRAQPGVSITCFMDCCHSGTISRVALGEPPEPTGESPRARYLVLTPETEELHRGFRSQREARSRKLDAGKRSGMPEVVFSACRDSEVAWETGGQGAFTSRAAPLLANAAARRCSNKGFLEMVKAAFGEEPSQHPVLDCAMIAHALPIMGGAVTGRLSVVTTTSVAVTSGPSLPLTTH